MWNGNNNGQGQQQNYGNQGYGQDPYDRLNNARPISNRDPYIEEGQHTLAVISIEEVPNTEQGVMARARFEVLESSTMRPGTTVGAVWFLQKPPPKPGMVTDSDRFADFCTRLKGAPAGYPIGADIRVLVRDRAAEQLARGTVIRAYGVKKIAKTTGKPFVVVQWTNVEQTPAQIAQMRAQIEAKGLVQEQRGTGGQFNGAPHPSQQGQQGGYGQPQQNAAPPLQMQQGAPQGQQGWGQPQGGPVQGSPQGWGQPQQGAPQGAPQGWGGGQGNGQQGGGQQGGGQQGGGW